MKTCPHCGKANDLSAFYCEACGQIIEKPANSDLYTVNQREEMYRVTSRSQDAISTPPNYQETPVYTTPASYSPYGSGEAYAPPPYAQQPVGMQTPYYSAPMYPPQAKKKRSAGSITLSIVLYLFGLSNTSFGLAGFAMGFTETNTAIGLAFCIPLLIGLIALIPTIILYKKPRLKAWMRLLIAIGLPVIGFIVLIIAAAVSGITPNPDKTIYIYMGGTFTIFGLLIMIGAII